MSKIQRGINDPFFSTFFQLLSLKLQLSLGERLVAYFSAHHKYHSCKWDIILLNNVCVNLIAFPYLNDIHEVSSSKSKVSAQRVIALYKTKGVCPDNLLLCTQTLEGM